MDARASPNSSIWRRVSATISSLAAMASAWFETLSASAFIPPRRSSKLFKSWTLFWMSSTSRFCFESSRQLVGALDRFFDLLVFRSESSKVVFRAW